MTEAEWQAQVIELAHFLGWRHLHVRRSIGKGKRWTTATNVDGWPDLFLWNVRRPERGLVAIELKSGTGTVTAEQHQVLSELQAAGVRTMVARPADLDAVHAMLAS